MNYHVPINQKLINKLYSNSVLEKFRGIAAFPCFTEQNLKLTLVRYMKSNNFPLFQYFHKFKPAFSIWFSK